MHVHHADASRAYPSPPLSQAHIKTQHGNTKGVQFAHKDNPSQSPQCSLLPQQGEGLQAGDTSKSSATTKIACGEVGPLPPDGIHLILPQAGKILWTVGPVYTNPKHSWVEPWPDTDKIRQVLQPHFNATARLHVQTLGEGSWNRSWTVTVTSDSPKLWSSNSTSAKVGMASKTAEAGNTNEDRHGESNNIHQDGPSLDGGGSGSVHRFVMRMASPVYPWFKVEAEVATMEYVRRHSDSIPVPRVLLYDSSSTGHGNTLGYEWILMEYMPGVEFYEAAHDMTLPQKLRLAERVADWEDELSRLRFPAIGSIYFTDSVAKAAGGSASSGSILLPHPWKLCEHDPDFCIGPAVLQEFLGSWRLSYPFFKGPFGDEGDLARSIVACRKFEASDPLQSLHSMFSAHLDLLEDLDERAKELGQHQAQQDHPPCGASHGTTQGQSEDLEQIRNEMTAVEAAIRHLRGCIADEASSRGLPTVHVDIEGPPRFAITRGKQMSVSALQDPRLRHGRNDLEESAAASEVMGQVVNKLWPPKPSQPPFMGHGLTAQAEPSSNLGIASPARPATLPREDAEQTHFETTGYTLHHWDISSHNVLVSPTTGEPVALLDWEQIFTASTLIRGYNWYPTLMAGTWAFTSDKGQGGIRQQELEARTMRRTFLARLKTRDSPLLSGFIQLCPHVSDRLQAGHESNGYGQVDDQDEEDDGSDGGCSCGDSDSDESSDDEEAQAPSTRLDSPQGLETARVNPEEQVNRARRALAVSVLAEASRDKYFEYNSKGLLARARKYFR